MNGIVLPGGLPLTPNLVLFAMLAGATMLAAVGVVAFSNATRSALCLVATFFLLAFMYFTMQAEMLGIQQILVYTGAIMVLFLFVIMLLNLGAPMVLNEKHDFKKPVGIVLGVALFGIIGAQLLAPLAAHDRIATLEGYGGPQAIGRTLFSVYVYPFLGVSILLMLGLVGSNLLAKRRIS